MQRDVKIGIVIGVLLIALVAIFWMARDQEDPPAAARNNDAETETELGPSEHPAPPHAGADSPFFGTGTGPVVDATTDAGDRTTPTSLGDAAPPPDSTTQPGDAGTGPVLPTVAIEAKPKIHTVKAGDTLASIAKLYYGSESKWKIIQEANKEKVPDETKLRIGVKLTIPPLKDQKSGTLPATVSTSDQSAGTTAKRTHTVAADETLSSISEKYYGSPNEWQRIYQANRSILSNPNRLQRGMVLVIPPKSD